MVGELPRSWAFPGWQQGQSRRTCKDKGQAITFEWGRWEQTRCASVLSKKQHGRLSQLPRPHGWVRMRGGILVAVSDGDQTVFLQESRTEQLSTGHTPGTNAVQPR